MPVPFLFLTQASPSPAAGEPLARIRGGPFCRQRIRPASPGGQGTRDPPAWLTGRRLTVYLVVSHPGGPARPPYGECA